MQIKLLLDLLKEDNPHPNPLPMGEGVEGKIFKLIILKKWLIRKLNDKRVMEEIPMPRDLV